MRKSVRWGGHGPEKVTMRVSPSGDSDPRLAFACFSMYFQVVGKVSKNGKVNELTNGNPGKALSP